MLTAEILRVAGIVDDAAAAAQLAEDVNATYSVIAPCISEPEFPYMDAMVVLMKGTAARWQSSASSEPDVASVSHTAGVFSESTSFSTARQATKTLLPVEIENAQALCRMFRNGSNERYGTVSRTPERFTWIGGEPWDFQPPTPYY